LFERVWTPQRACFCVKWKGKTNQEIFFVLCRHNHISLPDGLVYYHLDCPYPVAAKVSVWQLVIPLQLQFRNLNFGPKNRNLICIIDCPTIPVHWTECVFKRCGFLGWCENGVNGINTNQSKQLIPSRLHECLFVCLFSCRYNPLLLYFHSPVAGFSLLVFEVSWSHTTTRHSR